MREAIFDLLGPLSADTRVLDLFAGSGALALEALSRGAGQAWVVERSAAAWVALARNALPFGQRISLQRGEALAALAKMAGAGLAFELVFLDPPYQAGLLAPALERLLAGRLLAPGARIVVESLAGAVIPAFATLSLWKERRYGSTQVTILKAEEA